MLDRTLALSVALVLLGAGSSVHAGLLGNNITLNYHYVSVTATDVVTVGAGVEFNCPTGAFNLCSMLTASTQTVDIGDQEITYRYVGPGSGFDNVGLNGFDFQDLNLGSAITGIHLTTDIYGFDTKRVTFTDNSLQIDMNDIGLDSPGQFFTVQLLTQAVPEPGSLALLAAGLVAAAAASRQRRR